MKEIVEDSLNSGLNGELGEGEQVDQAGSGVRYIAEDGVSGEAGQRLVLVIEGGGRARQDRCDVRRGQGSGAGHGSGAQVRGK